MFAGGSDVGRSADRIPPVELNKSSTVWSGFEGLVSCTPSVEVLDEESDDRLRLLPVPWSLLRAFCAHDGVGLILSNLLNNSGKLNCFTRKLGVIAYCLRSLASYCRPDTSSSSMVSRSFLNLVSEARDT